jgi:hypothetical protein
LGFREVDSVFDIEFDPPGAKPKGVSPALLIKNLEAKDVNSRGLDITFSGIKSQPPGRFRHSLFMNFDPSNSEIPKENHSQTVTFYQPVYAAIRNLFSEPNNGIPPFPRNVSSARNRVLRTKPCPPH